MEIQIWGSRCPQCEKKMEKNMTHIDGIPKWLLFERCHRCQMVFFLSIFDDEPIEGRDYIFKDEPLDKNTLVPHEDVKKRLKERQDGN